MTIAVQSSAPKSAINTPNVLNITGGFPVYQSSKQISELKQENAQLNELIDRMPNGVVILDGNGVVTKINAMAKTLLDEPILGQAWAQVIKRSFQPRKDDWHEVSLKDGRRVKLEISSVGNKPGQLITITDLTETRLLQDKLSHMQRLSSLGKMVSSLAHQIRTPLSSAMLYCANLKNGKLTTQARDKFQDKLMTRLQDLESQVNDMLLFSKSGSEQVVEVVSVNDTVKRAYATIEGACEKYQAQVNLQLCQDDCQILANQHALSGAIQNLINNSLEIIGRGAKVNVRTYCSPTAAFISVQDNGPGIAPEFAEKVFEPFYTSRSQGTGLGLAVVKSVLKAHQGQVHLLSKSGEGAHFCLEIPLASQINQTPSVKPEAEYE
ncbi:PAS domain-containing sensor histidine kinase [Thalassotalea sp. LPB0316]|uniref:sensor histidine kinase n=1 Tax=Thalassotalea sp. LPB0316 TaxID=2769490 RepID=UPI0018661514|nr:ATP-binding protein [Thalassotalea sp. LPB0316]QOL27089.1 PAS domain-containing sensor histidine kinase [Thalassotalea sp. LPB0316]